MRPRRRVGFCVNSACGLYANNASVKSEVSNEEDSSLKETAKDFLSDVLSNPKLKSAASNLIEKFADKFQ